MNVPPSSALSKSLFKSGLTFRGQKAGDNSDVVQLQVLSISESNPENTDTQGLCSTCQSYGLEYLHLLECPVQPGEHQHDENLWLRTFDTRSHFQDDCTVCELLVSLLPGNSSGPWRLCWVGFGWWSRRPNSSDWAVRDEFLNWDFLRTPGLVVGPDKADDFEKWWKERSECGIVLPTRKVGEDTALPRARYLESQSVDFGAAKSWIETCEEIHASSCGGAHQEIEGLQVIDCRTKRVVTAPSNCQYFALNFYREPGGKHSLESLPDWDSVPALFRDALTTTVQLGCDYLWIDRYCQPTNDCVEKEGQWRHVEKVYSEAKVTIIATYSVDSSIGLSGVGEFTRQQSTAAILGDCKLVAMHSKEVESVWKSKWFNEGFGYEECLLSRRRLLFTDHGLLFQCSGPNDIESYATEALDMTLGASELRASLSPQVALSDVRFVDQLPETVWNYLKTYTKKSRPDRPDSLNAFRAILNKFASLSKEFDYIWAMPVYQRQVSMPVAEGMQTITPPKVRQTYAERLVSSLVWEATDAGNRRPEFPSWSWTSSTAVIECEDYNIRNLDLEISIETEASGRISINEYFSQPTEQRPQIGKGLYFNGPVIFIDLDAPMVKNGWYIPVTSFDRKDSLSFRHGLRAMKTWDEDMIPGRYLTLILGASQASRTSWLTYHLLVLKEKEGHYERGFVLEVKDADLNNRVPEETWVGWMEESMKVLCPENFPWIYADFPANFGFEQDAREDWEKVFLIAKHLRVENREVFVR